MIKKFDESTEKILDKLAVSENRMQYIEVKHAELKGFEKKFAEFGLKFNTAITEL